MVEYGITVILSNFFSLMLVIIVSFILNLLVINLAILFTLVVTRPSAGGFHGSTPRNCIIFSVCIVNLWGALTGKIMFMGPGLIFAFHFAVMLAALFTVIKYAPYFAVEKPRAQKTRLRRSGVLKVILLSMIAVYLQWSGQELIAVGVSAGLIMQSLLLLPFMISRLICIDYFINDKFLKFGARQK